MTLPEDQPPAGALPDGSMPVYANHPLPGMPGGDPPTPALGWGPEFGAGQDFRHGGSPHRRAGLALGLLVICALAAAIVITALVTIA
ncbi:hypothetical protein ACGFIF_07605 [Kribbella sp. NPDC049174]|uniref:hypothetical protein n=1 Tax=Kribbella sp. NPDC049174 TaxID=3364112 RepID=UPI0037108642